jgi:hypothetical protein
VARFQRQSRSPLLSKATAPRMIVFAGSAAPWPERSRRLQSRSSLAHGPKEHERHWNAALPASTTE